MKARLIQALAVVGAISLVTVFAAGLYGASCVSRGFSARDEPSAMEATMATSMRRWSAPATMKAARNPVAATPDVLADARAHWADHCASCHANDGSGQTELGRNLYPRAPDMRLAATQDLSDGELAGIIENGIRLTGMPAWGPSDDNWKLVAFIRHLPALAPAELRAMEKLNPKGPDERAEEQDEDDFLKGNDSHADAGLTRGTP